MEKLEASSNADEDVETPGETQNQENIRCVHLFNCDKTYKLDVVEKLFKVVEKKLNFAISIKSHYFALRDMSQVCENIIPDQIKVDDVAVFVVHAHESRLCINEDNAGILGYAKIYRALLQATGGKVLVVIGGDDSYKDSAEEQGSFLSRWARRKIFSQFSEEYLDGRKSFIFSWDKKHRSIHEEALLHYYNPDKKDEKFVLEKKGVEVQVTQVVPKQTGQKGREETVLQQLPQKNNEAPQSMEIPSGPSEENKEDENIEELDKTYVKLSHDDATEDTMDIMDTNPPQGSIAILIRDESDINTIKKVFGDAVLQSINPVTLRDPRSMKDLLLSQITPVRSCSVIVESTKIKEEFLTNSSRTVYQELLKTANRIVEKKIVVILCSEGKSLTPGEEESITATIKELLGKKGLVFWSKGNNKTKRSHSPLASNLVLSTHVERSINPEEFTLVLKTRLLRGKISYDEKDVKVRLEGWTAPWMMTDNLFREWKTTNSAELSVYRENKTGKERTVVRDLESGFKGALLGLSGLTSVGERVADRANAIGTEKDEDMADEEVPFVLVSPEDSWPKTEPKRTRAKGMDTSPPQERIAILIRDKSDMNTIKEVFGDVLLGINPVTLNDPSSMKDLLLGQSTLVRSCFIVVEPTKLLTKSSSEVYLELLKTANAFVEKKIVVILCSGGKSLTYSEEESIKATIKELLGEKGSVFWWKGNNKTKRSSFSRSYPLPERPKNPEELVFKTRLLRGKISYDKNDVKVRVKGWTVLQNMAENLLRRWQTTERAELTVYRELETGNERTVVTEDLESRFKGALGRVGFTSDGANVSGEMSCGLTLCGAIRQYGSNLMSEDGPPEESSNISSANSQSRSPP